MGRASALRDVKNQFGRTEYTPFPYDQNPETLRFSEQGGHLDRIIYEVGIVMVYKGIDDPNEFEFYTLKPSEVKKVWKEVADRLRACNSPFKQFRSVSSGRAFVEHIFGSEENMNEVIARLYKAAEDFEGLRDFSRELRKRGYFESAVEIEKTIPETV